MFIDTHCHISEEKKYLYIENAKNAGVNIMLNASEDYATSIFAVNLSKEFDSVYACIGVHPENADSFNIKEIDKFRELCKNDKVVALGEIGLDYYYTKDNRDKQIEVFKAFLDLASEINLPVVIHTRDAIEDTINILKEYKVKGVIHCFSGSSEVAKEYIKLGFALGIGGVLTFKNSKLKDTVKNIPLEYIVLETDSPFLSPEPFRGSENESKNIPIIGEVLAQSLGKTKEEIEIITTDNARRIFDKIR